MHFVRRLAKYLSLFVAFGFATYLALRFHGTGLWQGLAPTNVANAAQVKPAQYDLTQLKVVNEVLKTIRDRYVDPKRVRPREMLLSALNYVQRDVAQVIVLHEDGAPTATVRVDTQEKEFRVDNVLGPWDVSARLRDVFAFVQDGLRGTDVDLREVEYAACNGMLHTLDPHSVLLSPDAYKEMNLTTSGHFGGLGIVISIRDQELTVMNPMPGTPASRAGIKKYDRIAKINNESTLNMGLNEAVNHLRGDPGTPVKVYIHRDGPEGWPGSRPFDLVRETIQVASVEHRMLDGGIGYVRIKQFQANTATDLDNALADLHKSGELRGLVLDLRNNPGGLLDQAARTADKFISEGPIVATVGNPSEGREEKIAHGDGTEPNYPIAMLVNGSSASASEIVAGAMKNHDRAVLIGETTFGKGSVQLVFNELPDKAALKLTIAQYLTEPGDISIQGTGVTPDVELDAMTVDAQEMDLTTDSSTVKERDLSRSLSNTHTREGQHPEDVVRFALSERDRQETRERNGELPELSSAEFPDFPVKFAREFVAHVQPGKRLEQVRAAKAFITEARAAELAKVATELQKVSVDWSDAPADVQALATPAPQPGVEVKLETDVNGKPQTEALAGDAMTLRVSVTNKGAVPLYRVFGATKSDNPMFENKELPFGRIDPGKTRTATVPLGWCEVEGRKPGSTAPLPKDMPRDCRIAKDALTRSDGIKVHFEEARGRIPPDAEARVSLRALERPVFAYGYQIVDNRKGNGDGRLQKGEELTMYLTVKNVGRGRSYETQANLHNLSGDGLLLHEGRFDISGMQPGQTKRVSFTFGVDSQLSDPEAKVELSIADRDLRENIVEKVRMPVLPPASVATASGTRRVKAGGAALYESPDVASRNFGRLLARTAVTVTGTADDFVRVHLDGTRFGFVRASDLESAADNASGALADAQFDDVFGHAPPTIELAAPVLVTRDSHVVVKGTTSDMDRLLDAYILVGTRKVFYRSNRNGADAKKMSFESDVPLRPGVNIVTVVSRENPDTMGHRTLIVRRDGPNGELLQTPKTEDDLAENAASGDYDE